MAGLSTPTVWLLEPDDDAGEAVQDGGDAGPDRTAGALAGEGRGVGHTGPVGRGHVDGRLAQLRPEDEELLSEMAGRDEVQRVDERRVRGDDQVGLEVHGIDDARDVLVRVRR